MSSVIALAGLSNSGKSTSMKYLDPSETFIVSCTNKQLQIPGFRKKYPKFQIEDKKPTGNWYISNSYENIGKILQIVSNHMSHIKTIVIDDANYIMSNDSMQTAMTKGYDKFVIQAKNYYDLIQMSQNLRDDITVIFISHIVNNGTDI